MSHTTASVIKFCGDKNIIEDAHYKELSNFIELVNQWFDVHNSSRKLSKRGKNAYGVNLAVQDAILDKMTHVMTHLRATNRRTLLPFQKGVIVRNNSLKGLYCYLRKHYDLEYIITRRLNQDI